MAKDILDRHKKAVGDKQTAVVLGSAYYAKQQLINQVNFNGGNNGRVHKARARANNQKHARSF